MKPPEDMVTRINMVLEVFSHAEQEEEEETEEFFGLNDNGRGKITRDLNILEKKRRASRFGKRNPKSAIK